MPCFDGFIPLCVIYEDHSTKHNQKNVVCCERTEPNRADNNGDRAVIDGERKIDRKRADRKQDRAEAVFGENSVPKWLIFRPFQNSLVQSGECLDKAVNAVADGNAHHAEEGIAHHNVCGQAFLREKERSAHRSADCDDCKDEQKPQRRRFEKFEDLLHVLLIQ